MTARFVLLAATLLAAACRRAAGAARAAPPRRPPPAGRRRAPARGSARLFHESDEANLRRNPIGGHVPRRLALRRPARRLYQRRILSPPSAPPPRQDLAALARDRPRRSSTPPTGSPTTSSNIRREDDLDRRPARHAGADRGPADQPFLRLPHFLSGLRLGRRARRRSGRSQDYENNLTRHREYRGLHRPRDRPLPPGPRLGRGRDQADHPQRHRPARHPAARRARGIALSTGRRRTSPTRVPEADGRGCAPNCSPSIRDEHLSRPIAGCATSSETTICPTPATASASSTCGAATGSTQRLIEENTTLPLTADEVHNLGLSEVARIRGEMDAIQPPDRLQRHARPVLRISSAPTAASSRRAARRCAKAITRSAAGSTRASASISRPSRAAALEIREVEAFRERNEAGGSYQDGTPDGIAARHLLLQRLRPALAADLGHGDALSPRRRARPSFPDQPRRRRMRRCPPSCASAATPPSSRAGRSTPRPCGTSSAWRPTPISASAASTTRCCARCGWSSTAASTPRAGPATRRSSTCSTIAA